MVLCKLIKSVCASTQLQNNNNNYYSESNDYFYYNLHNVLIIRCSSICCATRVLVCNIVIQHEIMCMTVPYNSFVNDIIMTLYIHFLLFNCFPFTLNRGTHKFLSVLLT